MDRKDKKKLFNLLLEPLGNIMSEKSRLPENERQ